MSTCAPNLTHSFFTICKIITFKIEEFFFPCAWGGLQCFGSQKNHFRILFLSALDTWSQNFMPTRGVKPWGKNQFPQGGVLKFTHKGQFLTTKKHMKNSNTENSNGGYTGLLACELMSMSLGAWEPRSPGNLLA
jgi:hypothetical protein